MQKKFVDRAAFIFDSGRNFTFSCNQRLGNMFLACDTAMDCCTIAIGTREKIHAQTTVPMRFGQAEQFFGLLQQTINKAGLDQQDISAIGVTRGPGSFTGIRVGLAATRGLGLALNIPVYGLSGFAGYWHSSNTGGHPACVVIESRRSDFFAQLFDKAGNNLTLPLAQNANTLLETLKQHFEINRKVVFAGNGAKRFIQEAYHTGPGPQDARTTDYGQTEHIAPHALIKLTDYAHNSKTDAPATPLYLRPPDAALPARAG